MSESSNACTRCGVENPVWFAPSSLWNEVMGPDHDPAREAPGFICPNCFIRAAEEYGAATITESNGTCPPGVSGRVLWTAWVLTPESGPPDVEPAEEPAPHNEQGTAR